MQFDRANANIQRIYAMRFAALYPAYVNKALKKSRTEQEVQHVICWLTGYSESQLLAVLQSDISVQDFFAQAPQMHPARSLISGVICGVRIEEIDDELLRDIRRLDKLIDQLSKGKSLDKLLPTVIE